MIPNWRCRPTVRVESVSKRESTEWDRDWEGDWEREGDWEWERERDWEGDWERVGDDNEIEREIEKVIAKLRGR